MSTKQSARPSAPGQRRTLDTPVGFPTWQNDALQALTRAGQAYTSGIAAISEEMASFMQTRLQHNIALGESLARCHSLTDMANLQRDWLKETTEEYAAETQKLMELGSNLMRESLAPVEQAASQVVEAQTKAPKQD